MDARVKRSVKPQDIVVLYTVQHLSCSGISKLSGITRQEVWKILRSEGINTSKGKDGGTRVAVNCDFCGKEIQITRFKWRRSAKHFCSNACYFASIENPGYHPWRQGQRLARAIISQYFTLQEGNIVHHKDGDNRNNDRSNLAVYQSQANHMNHHRGGKIKPIWEYPQTLDSGRLWNRAIQPF